MDREEIIDMLNRKIDEESPAGGKLSKVKHLFKDDADLYNQYKDDGTMQFKKTRIDVMKEMAISLFGISDVEAKDPKWLAAIPKSDIDKQMAKLARQRQIAINKLLEQYSANDDVYEKQYQEATRKLKAAKIKATKTTEADLFNNLNPYTSELSQKPNVKEPRKQAEIPSTLGTEDAKTLMIGNGRKKKARKPSEYAKKLGVLLKKGHSIQEAHKMLK